MVLRDNPGTVMSAALFLSCLYNYARSQEVICSLGDCRSTTTTIIMAMFPRAVAVGCMVSRAAVLYKNVTGAVAVYEGKIAEYEAHYPEDACGARFRRAFVTIVVVTCAAIIIPVNVYRIHLLYRQYRSSGLIVFHALMYVQNASTCVTELQFVVYCFGLCRMFCHMNGDMSALRSEAIVVNRYPPVLMTCRPLGATTELCSGPSLVDGVERLKLRHQFISGAVRDLNALYSFQLVASLSVLFAMSLFDIYGVVSNVVKTADSHLFFYGWVLQYAFRFSMIVLTTHVTTKQALKSKIFITDINTRLTDSNTKEELRLFLDELCGRSVEFTTFDMFIINTRLITSAIVTGTTYLIILFQFQ
ncbi:unnamed protein product [Macrosiphum euphorbiae]|uniref:Gustatory receptor n=1 Tax=Macrosiphum euphorbiae TaxID=13131 RepID=A0AAV0WHR9_9HEMI|nr:unnamed protein product [Macrosiphum euphorbiae]